jgi:hypothetical protein
MFHPFSIQIDLSIVSCVVAMLVDAIDALSGGLHKYLLMRELSASPQHVIQHFSRFEYRMG